MSTLLSKLFGAKSRKPSPGKPFRPQRAYLQVEELESRLVQSITYQGGPILDRVYVQPVYLGSEWNSNPAMARERRQLDAFLKDVVKSPLMTALSEYYMNDPYYGQVHVGKGYTAQSVVLDVSFRTNSSGTRVINDGDVQSILSYQVDNGYLGDGPETLMMVFTPAGVVAVNNDATNTARGDLAHHSWYSDPWYGQTAFGLIPNPIGNPNSYWNATATDLQRLTGVASHEFEEAVTDPQLNAWYDASPPKPGITENGDYTTYYKPYASTLQKGSPGVFGQDQQYSLLNGYAVQNVWSVKANNTVALPQTPADLAGTTFNVYYNNSNSVVGVLSIQSEDPSTGAFSGLYKSYFGWIAIGGQLSNTTTNSGTMTSKISFSGAGYNYPYYENVSYQGQVTGNGNANPWWPTDSINGNLYDFVYYVPNNYSYLWGYGGPTQGTDS